LAFSFRFELYRPARRVPRQQKLSAHDLPPLLACRGDSPSTTASVAHWHKVKFDFIWPVKLAEHAMIESFNGRFRQECLNSRSLTNVEDAQVKIEA
jgi:putative transposase